MDPARWNEIIATAAATAIDECPGVPTVQEVAKRAATLAAEWICEELAEEAWRTEDGEEAANPRS